MKEPQDYIGMKYTNTRAFLFIENNGRPQTLDTTDFFKWVAYFPDGDLTILMDKKNSRITNCLKGKHPEIEPCDSQS